MVGKAINGNSYFMICDEDNNLVSVVTSKTDLGLVLLGENEVEEFKGCIIYRIQSKLNEIVPKEERANVYDYINATLSITGI